MTPMIMPNVSTSSLSSTPSVVLGLKKYPSKLEVLVIEQYIWLMSA